MQVIRTKTFSQTRKQFAMQVLGTYFRTKWVFLVLLFVVAGMQWSMQTKYANYFVVFAFLFPVMLSLFIYFVTGSKNLTWYYQEKSLRIDKTGFKMDLTEGKSDKVKWDKVKKVKKTADSYQLFNDPPLFMSVPYEAFHSEEDRIAFDNILRENKLLGGKGGV